MEWSDVTGWVGQGGAFLGIKRTLPEGKYAEIAARLRQFKIQALLVIGGFEVSRITRPKCPQDAHFFPEFRPINPFWPYRSTAKSTRNSASPWPSFRRLSVTTFQELTLLWELILLSMKLLR